MLVIPLAGSAVVCGASELMLVMSYAGFNMVEFLEELEGIFV